MYLDSGGCVSLERLRDFGTETLVVKVYTLEDLVAWMDGCTITNKTVVVDSVGLLLGPVVGLAQGTRFLN